MKIIKTEIWIEVPIKQGPEPDSTGLALSRLSLSGAKLRLLGLQ